MFPSRPSYWIVGKFSREHAFLQCEFKHRRGETEYIVIWVFGGATGEECMEWVMKTNHLYFPKTNQPDL